ncbi:MAG: hypothetical protein AAF488_17810, partial [Planctomycetota bacterium]
EDIAVKLGFTDEGRLEAFLSIREEFEPIDLSTLELSAEAMARVPRELVEEHRLLASNGPDGSLLLVMGELDLDAVVAVKAVVDGPIRCAQADVDQIVARTAEFFEQSEREQARAQASEEVLAMVSDPAIAALARTLINAGVLDPAAWQAEFNSLR